MTDLYFVYCPESGFDCFLTLDAALDDANERIQGYLGDAWSEEVTGVCAGKITHRAKMCDQVLPDGEVDDDGIDDAGEYWDQDWEYKCNYKMFPVKSDYPDLVESLERLVLAAQCRDNSTGDQIRLIETRAELSAAAKNAEEALALYRQQGGDL